MGKWIDKYDDIVVKNKILQERCDALQAKLDDWENRESVICPEDVGFEEYIHRLQKKLDEAIEALKYYTQMENGDLTSKDVAIDALSEFAKPGGDK